MYELIIRECIYMAKKWLYYICIGWGESNGQKSVCLQPNQHNTTLYKRRQHCVQDEVAIYIVNISKKGQR